MFDLLVARVSFYSLAFSCFVRSHFVCTFVIYTRISLTILIFVIFVPTFIIFRICAYIFVGNLCKVKILIIHVQTLICIFQDLKLLSLLCNKQG